MTPSFIDAPQGRLAFYEQGTGDGLAVLFLHADSGVAGQWNAVLPAIAADRRVIALDSRGSGQSGAASDGDYSYEGRARDIDPGYGRAFDAARAAGVEAFARRCRLTQNGIDVAEAVPIAG